MSNILNGATNSGGNTTVLGNPAVPASATATSGAADGMHVAMVGGMPGQPMAVQGPVMTGMPLPEGSQPEDPSKAGMTARGMPAPALNANQVGSTSAPLAPAAPLHVGTVFTDTVCCRFSCLLL